MLKIQPLRHEGTKKTRFNGSGLPWPPARSLRLGERDCFEYAWVALSRCDRKNKSIHI